MSQQAVTWALAQPIDHSPARFILTVMAHHAAAKQQPWVAFASITTLANQTGQDRKTVIANLKRLTDAGYLVDTGERAGVTKSVVIYELSDPRSSPETGTAKQSQNRATLAVPKLVPLSSPETGTASNENDASSPKSGTASGVSSPETGTAGKPEAVPVFPTELFIEEVIPLPVGKSLDKPTSVVKKSARGDRLPNDWVLPKRWGDEAMRICPAFGPDKVRDIAAEFRDYWVAVPGSKGCKLDWEATWRNWVRKEAKQVTRQRGRATGTDGYDQFGVPL